MARIDLNISGLVDLRDTLPGDAYNWRWVRELSLVNYLAIHQSGGLDTQTPVDLANYHIQNNGWDGIGYHFIIDQDGIVYYVGDISTARANVADLNEAVIGICLIGNFSGNLEPTPEQLTSTHKLCEFLINYPGLVNIKSWDKIVGHKELPNQQTDCPGDNWDKWKVKLIKQSGRIIFNSKPNEEKKDENDDKIKYQKTQIDSLQLSLATVNSQLISCRESMQAEEVVKNIEGDQTLTMTDALVNLYKFIFPPGKTN